MKAPLVIVISMWLVACTVGPDYHRPTDVGGAPPPAAFVDAGSKQLLTDPVEPKFWQSFGDDEMTRLIMAAIRANPDIEKAHANLLAARAAFRLSTYDLAPTVTSSADYLKEQQSENQLPPVISIERKSTYVDVGFDAHWELDFFGRVRREVESGKADADAAEASLRDAQVTVIAEVARDYCTLRGLQEQLSVALENVENQRQSLQLTEVRLEAGRGNELDTARADAQLLTTQARIPTLKAQIAATLFALSVLVGQQPGTLDRVLSKDRQIPVPPMVINIGSPEDLLRRRPDVQVAERRLAAATARIGVAMGDLFPKVTVLGAVGFDASSFAGIGHDGSRTYSYGPSITWAAFDLGRVQARIRASKANADAELAGYQSAVLGALQEVDSDLAAYARSTERLATLRLAAAASDKAARLARQRFEGGLSDFLNVLDAERDELDAETSVAQSETEVATDLIALYKALGGAWEGVSDASRDAPTQVVSQR
jgi:multidrug efflux system outer membrane protein